MSDPVDLAADAIATAEQSVTSSKDAAAAAARDAKAKLAKERKTRRMAQLARDMGGEDHPFTKELRWAENGLSATLTNITLVLTNHPHWKKMSTGEVEDGKVYGQTAPVFAWNKMTHAPIWVDAPPWPMHVNQAERVYNGTPITDDDITRVQMFFESEPYNCRISDRMARAALVAVAHQHPVHPLQDDLSKLKWDGVPRLNAWLMTHLGAQPEEQPQYDPDAPELTEHYLACVGRWWLMSAVARAFMPGCQVDSALILEGPQGTGKTSALRVLGGRWYTGALLDLESPQNLYPLINNRWIVELAEFHSIMKASPERTKAFLTETHNEWTKKFSNDDVAVPRSCVFAATINPSGDDTYLRDPTGERRWWPVRITRDIDLEKLKMDRDSLIAEAFSAFTGWSECNMAWQLAGKAAGKNPKDFCQSETDRCSQHRWWPSRDESTLLQAAQRARSMPDTWDDLVMQYVLTQPMRRICHGIQSKEIAEKALKVEASDKNINSVVRRVHECLRRAGAIKGHRGGKGKQIVVWKWKREQADALRMMRGITDVDDNALSHEEVVEARMLSEGGGE